MPLSTSYSHNAGIRSYEQHVVDCVVVQLEDWHAFVIQKTIPVSY